MNLIIIDKQPELAVARHGGGEGALPGRRFDLGVGGHGRRGRAPPDVVLACAGDVPTLETLAAVDWLRENAPELHVRSSMSSTSYACNRATSIRTA